MLNDFLFEIGTEELPFAAVLSLGKAFTENISKALTKEEISYENIKTFATPRRLAIWIHQLTEEKPAKNTQRRGPALSAAYDAEGRPTAALLGFAKSCKVSLEELKTEKTDKGSWIVYEVLNSCCKTKDLMPELVRQALLDLPIRKPMRWGEGLVEFVRPVHWMLMLWNEEVLPFEMFHLKAGPVTYGHRFHAPDAIAIQHPNQYEAALKEAYVITDFSKRRREIVHQIEAIGKSLSAKPLMPEPLLDEVTSIVEWPKTLQASFDTAFLEVPPEALIASMQTHQKCFAFEDKASDKLMPFFAFVSNICSKNPEELIKGNEKVMRARLSDADFFFRQDKKLPLSARIQGTEQVIFQAQLGTVFDKTERMKALMSFFASCLNLDSTKAERAAELCKCDLITGMVGEFPELQGIMGYYYALHDGEDKDVAKAIADHYLPRFSGDKLPSDALSQALSLADRLDTLVGIFALSQKPSGDKDPFKLRRHALALARIVIMNPKIHSLQAIIDIAFQIYGSRLMAEASQGVAQLHPFILERLQAYYQAEGIGQDIFQAVKVCQSDWLYDMDKRLHALADFITLPAAKSLASACKRVKNILEQEPNILDNLPPIDESLLQENAEKVLLKALLAVEKRLQPLSEEGDYAAVFKELSSLKEPVDQFFEAVMVMVNDNALKKNRLALLLRLNRLLQGSADISLLHVV